MGKKKKKKFAGEDTAYDYLKKKFDKNYRSFNANRQSEGVYKSEKDDAFQRYLYTGKKSTGKFEGDKKDKKKDKADRLFEAGIPVQQWDYYKDKAGNNASSKGDIKDIIKAYNADERGQGSAKDDNEPKIDGTKGLEYYNDDPQPDDKDREPTELELSKERTDAYERRMAPEYFDIDGEAGLNKKEFDPEAEDAASSFRTSFRDRLLSQMFN